ncbi:MAG: hypothetical protein AB1458_01935 [Bacteroidota bacterium]
MPSKEVGELLKKAQDELALAHYELNRQPSSIMTLCVCHSIRISAISFLRAYLVGLRGGKASGVTLEELFTACCHDDSDFVNIDLTGFLCRTLHEDCVGGYCRDLKRVASCLSSLKEMRELVLAKLHKPYSN